jgi:hypothetical protein
METFLGKKNGFHTVNGNWFPLKGDGFPLQGGWFPLQGNIGQNLKSCFQPKIFEIFFKLHVQGTIICSQNPQKYLEYF